MYTHIHAGCWECLDIGPYTLSLVQDGPRLFSVVFGSIGSMARWRENACTHSIPHLSEGPDNPGSSILRNKPHHPLWPHFSNPGYEELTVAHRVWDFVKFAWITVERCHHHPKWTRGPWVCRVSTSLSLAPVAFHFFGSRFPKASLPRP